MSKQNPRNIAIYFFVVWVLLNFIQATGTELIADEAYYWVYAQHLDWGYFEQPPATAFCIWLGTSVFGGELGVRLLFVLASATGLYAIWRLTDPKDQILYFTLLLSIGMAHLGGFLAVPDIPLIFTSGVFFLLYKSYLQEDKWSTAIWLGLTVAAMSYSKYHAVVVLMSALAGAWWLIKRPSFWIIPLLATVLYLPHLFWQVANDYPPLRYHLVDRQAEPWTPLFAINYILSQLLVFGPLIGFILFPAAWKFRSSDRLTFAMRWCTFGIFGFFLLLSLKGRVEANWTASAIGPLLYLAYHYIAPRPKWRKWVFHLAWPSLLLIGLFRLYMLFDFLPRDLLPRNEFHGWKSWALTIQKAAGDRPVVFFNTYQRTSRYWFYSGHMAHSQSLVTYAGDQYDLLSDNEASLQGKAVLLMDNWNPGTDTLYFDNGQKSTYLSTPAFHSFNRVRIEVKEPEYVFPADTLIKLPVRLSNPTSQTIRFTSSDLRLKWFVFQHKKYINSGTALDQIPVQQLTPGESIEMELPLRTPNDPGNYRFRFCIEWSRYPGRNGSFTRLIVH